MRSLGLKFVLLSSLIGALDCTFLLELKPSQCSTTDDCMAKGPAFAGRQCVQGSCEIVQASSDAGPQSSTDGDAAPSTDAPEEVGTDAEDAETPVEGGTAGCTSTAQCIADNFDEPYVCRRKGDPCFSLKSAACPLVFGDYHDENSIVFGAFLTVPDSAPLSEMSTLNVRLAIDEFNGSVGGLPGGPLGKLRPLAAVVCRNDPSQLEAGASHLIDGVGAHAIVAHLSSANLKTLFANHAFPSKTLVVNPGFADNTLTSLTTDGLFWHMIGDVRDVVPAYPPLVARIETHLRALAGSQGANKQMRVAMLVADRIAETSIAEALNPVLQFNGKTVHDNGENFFKIKFPARIDDPTADYSTVVAEVLQFRPDVVLAIARDEFSTQILPGIEAGWAERVGAVRRPFYVLPNALSGDQTLLRFVGDDSLGATSEDKRKRFAGIAAASAEDLTLYKDFLLRFRAAYPRFQNPGGFENFYDAVYLLANAMYGAGSVPELTGPDIARGLQRVISGSFRVNVGPANIGDGFAALAAGGTIRLEGTMGPADFDPGRGTRRGLGSVYCIQRASTVSYVYDVLRYDATSKKLVGDFPCISGF